MIFHIIVTASIFAAAILNASALPQRLVIRNQAPSLNIQSAISIVIQQANELPAEERLVLLRDVAIARQDECTSTSKWSGAKHWVVTVELDSTAGRIERTAPPRATQPGCAPRIEAAPKRQSRFVIKPRPATRVRTA